MHDETLFYAAEARDPAGAIPTARHLASGLLVLPDTVLLPAISDDLQDRLKEPFHVLVATLGPGGSVGLPEWHRAAAVEVRHTSLWRSQARITLARRADRCPVRDDPSCCHVSCPPHGPLAADCAFEWRSRAEASASRVAELTAADWEEISAAAPPAPPAGPAPEYHEEPRGVLQPVCPDWLWMCRALRPEDLQ